MVQFMLVAVLVALMGWGAAVLAEDIFFKPQIGELCPQADSGVVNPRTGVDYPR